MAAETASTGSSLQLRPPLRVGIVGCALGRPRYGTALTLTPSVEVLGLADTNAATARLWARALGKRVAVFPNVSALLTSLPAPDALIITSPIADRAAHILQAVSACIPLLCEAPFAETLTETASLLRAAAENEVLLMPAFPRRFDTDFEQVASLLATGQLGEVQQARCDWSIPIGGATAENADSVEGWTSLAQQIACQTADICRWWLGDVQTVSADIQLPRQEIPGRAAGGHPPRETLLANIILRHTRGQSTHHLIQSRAQQPIESYLISAAQGRLELIVSAGERASSASSPSLTLHRTGQRPEPQRVEENAPALPPSAARRQRLLLHFADCARRMQTPRLSGEDARAAQEIVHAAFISSKEGSKVTLQLD